MLALPLLLVIDGTSGGMAGFGSLASVVYRLGGIVVLSVAVSLKGLVGGDVRFADGGGGVWRGVVSTTTVLLCVDVGDMRGCFALGRFGITGLLAVPNEVLEVLYGGHCQIGARGGRRQDRRPRRAAVAMAVRSMRGNREQNHAMQRKRRVDWFVVVVVVVVDGEVMLSGQGMAKVKRCDGGQEQMWFVGGEVRSLVTKKVEELKVRTHNDVIWGQTKDGQRRNLSPSREPLSQPAHLPGQAR